jgi:ferredoxin
VNTDPDEQGAKALSEKPRREQDALRLSAALPSCLGESPCLARTISGFRCEEGWPRELGTLDFAVEPAGEGHEYAIGDLDSNSRFVFPPEMSLNSQARIYRVLDVLECSISKHFLPMEISFRRNECMNCQDCMNGIDFCHRYARGCRFSSIPAAPLATWRKRASSAPLIVWSDYFLNGALNILLKNRVVNVAIPVHHFS